MNKAQLEKVNERHEFYYQLWLKESDPIIKSEWYGKWMGIELLMDDLGYHTKRLENNRWVFTKIRKTTKQ